MSTLPELLAPAGTLDVGLAAFDAGADAVYAGLPQFNARERGENLSRDDLSRLITYAHKHGRRVYVTLNTLIKEGELEAVAGIAAYLASVRPDAVILQDVGVVRLLRSAYPEVTIHASTQMGIHNSAGVAAAERMGIRRIILERQVTFDELELIRSRTSVELEVFVHGALCCGRSGACLLSSWMGGWSGNRGRCKQPCRRRYFSPEGNGFFFSTGDLYSLDAIGRLRDAGVQSLKIEGRLHRAEYIGHVVQAYRHVLDSSGNSHKALKEARAMLSNAPGRKWVPAFQTETDFDPVIKHRGLGAAGLLCGEVVDARGNRFLAQVARPLKLGDVVRVQPTSGDEGPSITIGEMIVDGKAIEQARRGQRCWIRTDRPVANGSRIFKTDSVQSQKKRRELPAPGRVLDLSITLDGERLSVQVGPTGDSWEMALELEEARKHALQASDVAAQFRRAASARLAAGTIDVTLPPQAFVPLAKLRDVRRAFWEWAEEHVTDERIDQAWQARVADLSEFREQPEHAGGDVVCTVRLQGGVANPVPCALTAHDLGRQREGTDEVVLPAFTSEGALGDLKAQLDETITGGIRRVRATSLAHLHLLSGYDDITVTVSFPCPVCNSLAVAEMLALGAERTTAWPELEEAAALGLQDAAGSAVERFEYGRLPLLSTRFNVAADGDITDGRGGMFTVVRERDVTNLYSSKVMAVPVSESVSRYLDLTHAQLGEEATDSFNYFRDFI